MLYLIKCLALLLKFANSLLTKYFVTYTHTQRLLARWSLGMYNIQSMLTTREIVGSLRNDCTWRDSRDYRAHDLHSIEGKLMVEMWAVYKRSRIGFIYNKSRALNRGVILIRI